jgi:CRP-like cAMP-binding protein
MTSGLPGESDLEAFLTRIPLFAEMDRLALAQLAAHLDPIVLEEGDLAYRQGDPGDDLYVVVSGRLGVPVHAPGGRAARRIDGLGPGDLFGEMALLTGEPRSATVRAETRSRVLRLERERFEALLREQPSSFLAIARALSRRLATANRMRLCPAGPRLGHAAVLRRRAGARPTRRVPRARRPGRRADRAPPGRPPPRAARAGARGGPGEPRRPARARAGPDGPTGEPHPDPGRHGGRGRAVGSDDRAPGDVGRVVPPYQTSSYMVARAAAEDCLFSHDHSRCFALAYPGLTLLGLALAVPYWRLLGLL